MYTVLFSKIEILILKHLLLEIFILPGTPSTQKFNGYTKTRRRLTTPPGQRADRTFDVPRSKMPHVSTDPVNLWYYTTAPSLAGTPAGPTQLRVSFQEDPDLCEEYRTTEPLPSFHEST